MKCSNYLWMYKNVQNANKDWSPERAQGELRQMIGDEIIVNDVTGAEITEREAFSVLGRNAEYLNAAYKNGDKESFNKLVVETFKKENGEEV